MAKPLRVGAVIYDPKVVVIWEIIGNFMNAQGCNMDTVFYTNYELMVHALVNKEIEIAWNSPLAWLDTARQLGGNCRAIAMRDTDRDRATHFIVRADSDIQSVNNFRGKTVAFGAKDSPQATLIPQGMLAKAGLMPNIDYTAKRFDVLVGKHGDHVGGELDALKSLIAGECEACCVLDLNWQLWSSDGTADPAKLRVVATTEKFDHCVFAVRSDIDSENESGFTDALFKMSYENPEHKEMMDMEGLKEWKPGRTTGFGPLAQAVQVLDYF